MNTILDSESDVPVDLKNIMKPRCSPCCLILVSHARDVKKIGNVNYTACLRQNEGHALAHAVGRNHEAIGKSRVDMTLGIRICLYSFGAMLALHYSLTRGGVA